jgi:RND family efflux transporter MFP subunit
LIKKLLIPAAIVGACGFVAIWMVMQTPRPAEKHPEPPVLLVEVIQAKASSVNIKVKAQGSVSPRTETTLVTEVSGMITEVSPAFQVGGFFKKGDVLIRIDDRNYRAEVKRAEAAVTSQKMNVTRETGLADYAASDFERSKSLLASQSATDLALRKPQLAEAISNLEFAEADLEKKVGDLDRTTIRAPYDGLVREKRVDIGQYVGAGTQLAVTFAVDYAEVRLPLPDRELPYLNLPNSIDEENNHEGSRVTLTAKLGGISYDWEGKIVRTEGVFDQRSRVLYVVAQIADPYNRIDQRWQMPLRIGTFVEATIEGRHLDNVIVLPRGVLRADNQVWTVGDGNTLTPNTVSLLRADEDYIYIDKGIDSNELVCKTMVDNPLPGTRVRYDEILEAVSAL